jgi:hypothetical protein
MFLSTPSLALLFLPLDVFALIHFHTPLPHMPVGVLDLVNCYKSLQKLNEDCENLRAQLKELEEAALPITRLLVPHPGGPKIAPLVDRLNEAPSRLAAYVKHLAKSVPNQVLAFMKSYIPKAPVDVVAGGLAANCSDEQYAELLEQMAPIAEQVADKLNLQ